LFAQEIPVPVNPGGYPSGGWGSGWSWLANLAHELGPMGFFALVLFVALGYVWWKQQQEIKVVRERFCIVIELQACFASILAKLCKGKRPPIDVENELEDIEELLKIARLPQENDTPWWKRSRR
jgi:hypothetical protein